MARPTKFKPEFVERAKTLCAAGALDVDLASAFGIALSTLYLWKHEFPEFSDAIKPAKAIADDAVEYALFRKATGYSFDSEKVFQFEGAPVRVDIVEHVPPSDTAMIFWLKNRRPDLWRDKTEQDVNLKGDLVDRIAAARKRAARGEQA